MRVHRPVPLAAKSVACAIATKPLRAASFWSTGIASSRLPSTTSTLEASSGTRARTFSLWGGTKWIIRSSLTGKIAERGRRAGGERLEEAARQFHRDLEAPLRKRATDAPWTGG